MRLKLGPEAYFSNVCRPGRFIAPSTGVVYFVAYTGKPVMREPGAMLEAETWSKGIFFSMYEVLVLMGQGAMLESETCLGPEAYFFNM